MLNSQNSKSFIKVPIEFPLFYKQFFKWIIVVLVFIFLRLIYYLFESEIYNKSYSISKQLYILSKAIPTNYSLFSIMMSAYIVKYIHDPEFERLVFTEKSKLNDYTSDVLDKILISNLNTNEFWTRINNYLTSNFCQYIESQDSKENEKCRAITKNLKLYNLKSGYLNQIDIYYKFWKEYKEYDSILNLYSDEFQDMENVSQYIQKGLDELAQMEYNTMETHVKNLKSYYNLGFVVCGLIVIIFTVIYSSLTLWHYNNDVKYLRKAILFFPDDAIITNPYINMYFKSTANGK